MHERELDGLMLEANVHPRRARRRVLHSSDSTRLVSMLGLLLVLCVLIARAKDPAVWAWLVEEEAAPTGFAAVEPPATGPHGRGTPTAVPAVAQPEIPAITDEDPEQRDAAREEFQAITDRTTALQPEEMPAYWRLMTWVEQQSAATLQARSSPDFVFNDLMQEPAVNRGRLLKLSLNVRRVLSYEVPPNPLGIRRLYEVWGFTNESKAWLYVGITAHLPEGLPMGPDVAEEALFFGYFFKVQGYLEAAAGPRAAPLGAPLLLGRLEWHPAIHPTGRNQELPWVIGLAALACLFVVGRGVVAFLRFRGRSHRRHPFHQAPERPTFDWIEQAPEAAPDNSTGEDAPTAGHGAATSVATFRVEGHAGDHKPC